MKIFPDNIRNNRETDNIIIRNNRAVAVVSDGQRITH